MMKKYVTIFSVVIFLTVNVFGQIDVSNSKPTHQLDIGLGGLHYQLKDDIIAPLRWDGIGFSLDLSYKLIFDKGRHKIGLRVPYATLSNRYNHKNTVAEINFGYDYIHRIAGKGSPVPLDLGFFIDWNDNLQYYESWDDSHLYWLNIYELGPVMRWSHIINDSHQIVVNLQFPVLAFVSRPPKYRYYDQEALPRELLKKSHEDLKMASVNDYLSFSLRGEYIYSFSRKVALGTSYMMDYKTFSKPERISLYTNSLQLNLMFSLGKNKKDKRE